MPYRLLCVMLLSCLVACGHPAASTTTTQFEAARAALAADDAFLAADRLITVIEDSERPEQQTEALEILRSDAFGKTFLESYIMRVPDMRVEDFVGHTELVLRMTRINPELKRQGNAVWDTLCARLQPLEGRFPVTARVGELMPCSEKKDYAERIYTNTLNYLRENMNVSEMEALERFTRHPARKGFDTRFSTDLAELHKSLPPKSPPAVQFSSGQGSAGTTAWAQSDLPGYVLKFPARNAELEHYVRESMNRMPGISPAAPGDPEAVMFEITGIRVETIYSQPLRQRLSYDFYDCWPSVQRRMSRADSYEFVMQETQKQSVLTATLTIRRHGKRESLPMQRTLTEKSIACSDYTIRSARGGDFQIGSYANSDMRAMCSRNRGYLPARAVLQELAGMLAEGFAAGLRSLAK